jgi:hypothetical protein
LEHDGLEHDGRRAYRFFGNGQVTPQAILAPHFRQSRRRAAEPSRVVVAYDTTPFEFGGQTKRGFRKGLVSNRHGP